MTDDTNKQSEDELDELFKDIASDWYNSIAGYSGTDRQIEDMAGWLKRNYTKAILSRFINKPAAEQREREARMDELEKIRVAGSLYGWGETFAVDSKYITERLAQLSSGGKEREVKNG